MLTYQRANAVTEPGRYRDDLGLYLNVAKGGSKSWILRIVVDGRRRDVGLGGFPRVTVGEARKAAAAYRGAVAKGVDPAAERQAPDVPTFAEAADAVFKLNAPTWAPHHANIWRQTVATHVLPSALAPSALTASRGPMCWRRCSRFWPPRPFRPAAFGNESERRWHGAQSYGHIDVNVAGEVLNGALPRNRPPVRHHAALDYRDAARAFAALTAPGAARLAVQFLTLTATRSGETRGARWDEVDLQAATWMIPPSRMKARAEHRVPLSRAALAVLEEARALDDGSGLCFPSTRGGEIDSETLRRTLKLAGVTCSIHGWRSVFRDWAAECTPASWASMELSLAHAVGSTVERSYARSDLLGQRRELMQEWADFLKA